MVTRAVARSTIYSWWSTPFSQSLTGVLYAAGVTSSKQQVVFDTDGNLFVLRNAGTFDDHLTPALLVPSDEPPFVAYTSHSDDANVRYRVGTVVGDITSFGAQRTISTSAVTTYCQLWRVGDDVWLLTRLALDTWGFFKSGDYGAAFGAEQALFTGGRLYVTSVQSGSTVRCAFSRHPHENDDTVRYCVIDLTSGGIATTDGTVLGNLDGTGLPVDWDDLEVAYSGPSGSGVRLFAVSDATNPEIGLATWTNNLDTVYRYVTHDGGAWSEEVVVAAGATFGYTASIHYNGGVGFYPSAAGGELLVSREDAGTWFVERWVRNGSWAADETIRTDTEALIRPWGTDGGQSTFVYVTSYPTYLAWSGAVTWGDEIAAGPEPPIPLGIWADATFVWSPGDAVTRSSDLITATLSDAALTEGAFVSSPRDGRAYTGAAGSRFSLPVADPTATGVSYMCAARVPSGTETLEFIYHGDGSSDKYMRSEWTGDNDFSVQYRNGGVSEGGTNWVSAVWDGDWDTSIHVFVWRITPIAAAMLIEVFVDGALFVSDRRPAGNIAPDRFTIGRFDRSSSPINSAGGEVFAAAAWERPLSDTEVRAVSAAPYGYPTEPADPDDWPVGVNEWADCRAYWSPGTSRSTEVTHGGGLSTGDLAEGTPVTVSSTDGRAYTGTQGGRIEYEVQPGMQLGQNDSTLMVVAARPVDGSDGAVVYLGDRSSAFTWFQISCDTAGNWEAWHRNANVAAGSNDSAFAEVVVGSEDTDLHVLVARMTFAGTSGSLQLFLDDFATSATDVQTYSAGGNILNRFTAGRLDDSSPNNSTSVQVFAAAVWDRALTDMEVVAVLADPFGFPGAAAPSQPAITSVVTDSQSALTVNWGNVADETGYRVERSPDGSGSWVDVSGNLAAETVTFQDTGLTCGTQYFYRVVAFNAVGDSDPSDAADGTTAACIPPTPSGNRMGGTGAIRRRGGPR